MILIETDSVIKIIKIQSSVPGDHWCESDEANISAVVDQLSLPCLSGLHPAKQCQNDKWTPKGLTCKPAPFLPQWPHLRSRFLQRIE